MRRFESLASAMSGRGDAEGKKKETAAIGPEPAGTMALTPQPPCPPPPTLRQITTRSRCFAYTHATCTRRGQCGAMSVSVGVEDGSSRAGEGERQAGHGAQEGSQGEIK
eukprot:2277920-Rhodomonas_salina.1